jgi:hypothetical protein
MTFNEGMEMMMQGKMSSFLGFVISVACVVAMGCDAGDVENSNNTITNLPAGPHACVVSQSFPYPDGIPFVGVHGNRENNDYIPCILLKGMRLVSRTHSVPTER